MTVKLPVPDDSPKEALYNLYIFPAQCFQALSSLPKPIIRSQASRVVSRNEVGSVFAVLTCSMVIGNTLGTVIYQGVFAATANTAFPGAAFALAAALLLTMIPLYW